MTATRVAALTAGLPVPLPAQLHCRRVVASVRSRSRVGRYHGATGMRRQESEVYVCPATANRLELLADTMHGDIVWDGALVSESGARYPIRDGIPNLIYPVPLPESDAQALAFYQREAETYDVYLPLTFKTFGVDEKEVRTALVHSLNLLPGSKVLETGCGTG